MHQISLESPCFVEDNHDGILVSFFGSHVSNCTSHNGICVHM